MPNQGWTDLASGQLQSDLEQLRLRIIQISAKLNQALRPLGMQSQLIFHSDGRVACLIRDDLDNFSPITRIEVNAEGGRRRLRLTGRDVPTVRIGLSARGIVAIPLRPGDPPVRLKLGDRIQLAA